MTLPASGQLDFASIRNEFYNGTPTYGGVVYTYYGTDNNNLYNLNYYRGKYYFKIGRAHV